ncbi:MAG: hypothetical protein ABI954_03070, partial [Pyrinomonadaceae bacterium]
MNDHGLLYLIGTVIISAIYLIFAILLILKIQKLQTKNRTLFTEYKASDVKYNGLNSRYNTLQREYTGYIARFKDVVDIENEKRRIEKEIHEAKQHFQIESTKAQNAHQQKIQDMTHLRQSIGEEINQLN